MTDEPHQIKNEALPPPTGLGAVAALAGCGSHEAANPPLPAKTMNRPTSTTATAVSSEPVMSLAWTSVLACCLGLPFVTSF